jgi:hypothetical protein
MTTATRLSPTMAAAMETIRTAGACTVTEDRCQASRTRCWVLSAGQTLQASVSDAELQALAAAMRRGLSLDAAVLRLWDARRLRAADRLRQP